MKITLLSDDSIRLEGTPGPLTIEASSSERSYSPFHMLASALASCTYSVLASLAEHKSLRFDSLAITVSWEFADQPKRVGSMTVTIAWPELPSEQRERAGRVAGLCAVHRTLEHPPSITIEQAR